MRDMSNKSAKASMGLGQVISVVQQFLAGVPAGPTKDALQKALIDYADNSAAERRMQAEGNKADARRFNHEVGRANEVAVASWLRLGGSAKMADLRQVLQTLGTMSFSRSGAKARFEVLNANYAKMEVRYMKPDGQTETEIVSGSARAAVSSAIRRIEKMGDGAKVWVKAFVPAHPLGRFPAFENVIWKGEVKGGRAYEHGGDFSRPGAKAKFGSKRTTAGALRKQLKAQGMTDAAELEWHGISANDPDSTPYWLHEDGSMEKIKSSRPSAKVTAGRAENLYRQLSSGSITYANAKQWERLVTEALRLPDYTPPGGDMSLHEIAEDLGSDLMALKTHSGPVRASRPGAKARFAAPGIVVKEDAQYIYYYPDEDDRATFADDDGKGAYTVKSNRTGKPVSTKTYRSWEEAVRASNAINEKLPPLKKRKASMSRPGAKAEMALSDACWSGYEAVGTKEQDGKTVPNCVPKATAAKPSDLEREDVKAGLKLMEKADKAVSDKIRTLIAEGKPQDQAVAIALDMKRRGEL